MNSVRIIGGAWRRRVLRFPDSSGLRPTPDRVRETLFNWLGQELDGLTCLDLFAGSGALGFEAASRGAAKVVMVESAGKVAESLKNNLKMLGDPAHVEIVRGDAVQYLASTSQQFDVIFADPPYHQGWIERLAPLLGKALKADAALYLEAERALQTPGPELPDWRVIRHGKAGEVHYHLMRRQPTDTHA
ncbi:MAG TPA: 16S rRNA (guanine(966)-N(2))-methyltransferase RsmD [Rhodocyclaceae bacterium]|nr:16S rRNA (guanine(966)-N(2))-methyltransferase RsmD [Rhodocyclaceae bacterium]